jgi:putative hemolysin
MIHLWLYLALVGTAMAAGGPATAVMEGAVIPTVFLSFILLILSAFFSSSETALFGLQPVDLETMDGRGERHVRKLLAEPRHTLASILIGNETVNIALSTVTAGLLLPLFPDRPWLNVAVVVPMLLVFGEVLPKTFAFRFGRVLAPKTAPILSTFSRLVTPIRLVLSRFADAALVLTGGSSAPRQAELREAHLRTAIDLGRKAGNIGAVEQEILHRVFEFGDLTVRDLMTPQGEVFSVNLLTPWPELLSSLRDTGHSRIPMWQGSPNNIVGILLVKRLLALVATQHQGGRNRSPSPRHIHKLLLPPRFVPQTKAADELLEEFQARRAHMAIVVDEHGRATGVVTLDDLLEELVGAMHDETDKEDPAVTPLEPQSWSIRGDMGIDDFADRFHLTVPDGPFTTLSGLVSSLSVGPLTTGSEVLWNGMLFHIDEMDGATATRITVEMGHAYEEEDPTMEQDPETEEAS